MGTSLGVADTMALISSKLSNLVPFSACALFLFDEEADTLRCRFATGVEADMIGTMNVLATAILVISLILLAAGTLLRRKRFEG